jgi:hypothetical protein
MIHKTSDIEESSTRIVRDRQHSVTWCISLIQLSETYGSTSKSGYIYILRAIRNE